jgi:hypothetical protein
MYLHISLLLMEEVYSYQSSDSDSDPDLADNYADEKGGVGSVNKNLFNSYERVQAPEQLSLHLLLIFVVNLMLYVSTVEVILIQVSSTHAPKSDSVCRLIDL